MLTWLKIFSKQHSYDIILDSNIIHNFSNDDRQRYIENLVSYGLYIQLCFSEKEARHLTPRRMKKSDLNELFSSTDGWTIESRLETVIVERTFH